MAASIGQRLYEARERLGYSRAFVAAKARVDPALLYRLESGTTRNPSFATVAAVARALDVSLDELGAGEFRHKRLRPEAQRDLAVKHLKAAMELLSQSEGRS